MSQKISSPMTGGPMMAAGPQGSPGMSNTLNLMGGQQNFPGMSSPPNPGGGQGRMPGNLFNRYMNQPPSGDGQGYTGSMESPRNALLQLGQPRQAPQSVGNGLHPMINF